MPSVAIPGQPSPLRTLQTSSPTPTPPFLHSAPSPTQSHRSTSSSSSKDAASLGSYHSAHQQQPLQPFPPSPRGGGGGVGVSGPSHPPPLRSVDSSRSVQLAEGNPQGLAREQSMRGQVGMMAQTQPLPLPRGGTGWNVPLPSSNPSDEIWANPKRLSSNGSSNGWEQEGTSDGSGGGVVAGSVEDELEMALKRSPFVKVSTDSLLLLCFLSALSLSFVRSF
ncbi:hypothetical protein BDY24DRAFT_381893 [Mrakia frigida]|uniref:uncharacterized protein n=1 Tax=Mrakia frigida TaxID=29902 RepID=UPI003FCC16D0